MRKLQLPHPDAARKWLAAKSPEYLRAVDRKAQAERDAARRAAQSESKAQHIRRRALRMRRVLAARFPQCFTPLSAPSNKRPLKIGIKGDIRARAPDLDSGSVHFALADYTGGRRYLAAMKSGASRIDLDGNPAGFVAEGHALHATQMLHALTRPNEARSTQ